MGGVQSVSLSSRLKSQEGTVIQIGGVLPYKLEVYCSTFSRPAGVGVSEALLIQGCETTGKQSTACKLGAL